MSPIWFQILLALGDRDRHGLGIMNEVLERTAGSIRLWPAMLYRNLQKLTEAGLIVEVQAPAALAGSPRYFHLTAGKRACAAEARRLLGFVDAARDKRLLKRS
jgi:DNA-binding PadR family transcriptional regulator